jgi:hypothetical protein
MPRPTPQRPRKATSPAGTAAAAATRPTESNLRFSLLNGVLLLAGLLCIVVGFVLLAGGSVNLAPVLLVLGFVILIPLGIIL